MLSDVFCSVSCSKAAFQYKRGGIPSDFRHFRSCGQSDPTTDPNAFCFVKRAFGFLIAFRENFRILS